MPLEGFGVFQVPDLTVCEQAVYVAVCAGYRLIDTAQAYNNEQAVGKAVRRAVSDGIVTRDELFITTKVWISKMYEQAAYDSVKESLDKLGLGYADLILLHQPLGDYFAGYRGITRAYKEGIVRAIGVSNFYPTVLANFCETVGIIPAVNQIELHPFFVQADALELMKSYGIAPQAWAPLAEGRFDIFTHPTLAKIGARYGKTAAQTALRWNVQRGVCILPKSVHKERIEQNIDIWDFSLTDDEMQAIASLDMGYIEIADLNKADFVKFLHSFK